MNVLGGEPTSTNGKPNVKFRSPKDPNETWIGRGRRPNGCINAIKMGARQKSLVVGARCELRMRRCRSVKRFQLGTSSGPSSR
ncbi:MAG: H-NS family nucleoid-associated regulatory protein [Hyphomicrobiaceae bacterium]